MGSVVISEVVHDIGANYPPSRMIAGTPRAEHPTHRSRSQQSTTAPRTTSTSADRTPVRNQAPSQTSSQSDTTLFSRRHDNVNSHSSTAPTSNVSSRPESSASMRPPAAETASISPPRIKIRDLEHIQSFASEPDSPMSYLNTPSQSPPTAATSTPPPQYEISSMPVADVIEMVAGLLTKITSTNDSQAEHLHRNIPGADNTAGLSAQTSSVLAFHGKNIPSISIMSYLGRIHKYCPATYEVFLSLLVYFDRITEKVNASPMQSLRQANEEAESQKNTETGRAVEAAAQADATAPHEPTPSSSQSPKDLPRQQSLPDRSQSSGLPSPPMFESDPMNLAHFFVVDSFNIHRLVIAGVTCASKFFSDVFYTNSRYAKVGGLPLLELNQLELQFLLLNDFRLSIPVEELEAYATMLVEFYAREVLAQRHDETMDGVEASAA